MKRKTTPPLNHENKKINRDDLTFLEIIIFALVDKN